MITRKGRKGQIQDLLILPFILLSLGIVAFFLLNTVTTLRQTSGNTAQQNLILDSSIYAVKSLDSMNVFIFIILLLMIGGLAYMTRTNPLGMVAIIFIGLAIIVISPIFSNTYRAVAENPTIATSAQQFTLTLGIFDKLPYFILGGVILLIILLFGKPQVG